MSVNTEDSEFLIILLRPIMRSYKYLDLSRSKENNFRPKYILISLSKQCAAVRMVLLLKMEPPQEGNLSRTFIPT